MTVPVVRAREADAKRIDEDWGSLTWVAGKKLGNAERLTLGRAVIRKGAQNPRHCHPNCAEVLYLLGGKLRHTVGDEAVILEPGDTLAIPAGVFHHAASIGEEDAEMIVAYDSGERQFVLERDEQGVRRT